MIIVSFHAVICYLRLKGSSKTVHQNMWATVVWPFLQHGVEVGCLIQTETPQELFSSVFLHNHPKSWTCMWREPITHFVSPEAKNVAITPGISLKTKSLTKTNDNTGCCSIIKERKLKFEQADKIKVNFYWNQVEKKLVAAANVFNYFEEKKDYRKMAQKHYFSQFDRTFKKWTYNFFHKQKVTPLSKYFDLY